MKLESEIEAIIWGQTFAAAVGARLSVEDAAQRADQGIEQLRRRTPKPNSGGRYDGPIIVPPVAAESVGGPIMEEACKTS